MPGVDPRTHIEAEAQAALDVADRLIALFDGDTDREDEGNAEPFLAALASRTGGCD